MLHKIDKSPANTIGFKASGELTNDDYKNVLIPEVNHAIRTHGSIRLYWEMENFKGWEDDALWEDFNFGHRLNDEAECIAIVGDAGWIEWVTKLGQHFGKGKAKFFLSEKDEEAWYWLRTKDTLEAEHA